MTHDEDPIERTELGTTRLRGSHTAWIVALATVAILAGVVYLGLSGPRATTVQNPTAVAALPTFSPTPTPSRTPRSFDPNEIESIRVDPDAPVLYQYLGTALTINGRGTLAILDGSGFETPSTRRAADLLGSWGERPTLVVVTDDEEVVFKSFRNLERVLVTAPSELEVAALLWARSLVVSDTALPLVLARAGAAAEEVGQ